MRHALLQTFEPDRENAARLYAIDFPEGWTVDQISGPVVTYLVADHRINSEESVTIRSCDAQELEAFDVTITTLGGIVIRQTSAQNNR